MGNPAFADAALFLGHSARPASLLRRAGGLPRSRFGDFVLLVFLLAQCFDGVFTYVGVTAYGTAIEANPLIASLMVTFGHGTALMAAKAVAAALGIMLHLRQVHSAVAILSAFYIAVAIVPWSMILFT
jgi:uncharacterized membrane protein